MSRVDEALKRAASGNSTTPSGSRTPAARVENWKVDHYPQEAGRVPLARPDATAQASAAAPSAIPVAAPGPVAAPAPRLRRPTPAPAPMARTVRQSPLQALAPDIQAKLVASKADPITVEQYRRMGATLHDLQVERGLKTLMITSALPQDGKTLTAINLALTLSESYGRRVLLIDADLRRPSVHDILGLPNQTGLREALDSGSRELPFIDVGPRLTVTPAGRPTANPLAGLASEQMRSLLDMCEARFDWVLLDAPPVGLLPDAQLLSHLTGAVVFVIRAGTTSFGVVERAIREIGRDCIVGTVLNGVEDAAISSKSYQGHYPQM